MNEEQKTYGGFTLADHQEFLRAEMGKSSGPGVGWDEYCDLISAVAECEKAQEISETLRAEMKLIALATGRSKTDGESDCDWAFLGEEVARQVVEVARLRALVRHCWLHTNYPNCGYRQMMTEEKAMFDAITMGAETAQPSEEELRAMMRDPKYWRDRGPATVRKVAEGFRGLGPVEVQP